MHLSRGLGAIPALLGCAVALAACGGGGDGLSRADTRYFRFSRPDAWPVQVTRPAHPSHAGEIIARALGTPGTRKQRPLVAVDAMPGWTISLDALARAISLDDGVSYRGFRELGRTRPRVPGAAGATLIKGEAPGRDGVLVRTFDLLALSRGHLAVHMVVQVPKADLDKVPVQKILDSLQLRQ